MAAPCDPAPQNSIIVVCAVYVKDGDESPERIFAGAPCWYTDNPDPGANRKRTRSNRDDNDHTFVTTRYEKRKNSEPTSFAGICIGQPTHNRTGIVTIGVAISGAVTIARLLPRTDGTPPDPPNPGDGAFFGNSGIIEFKAARIRPPTLEREIMFYLRSYNITSSDNMKSLSENHAGGTDDWLTVEKNSFLRAFHRNEDGYDEKVLKILEDLHKGSVDFKYEFLDEEYSWARVLDTGSGNTVRLLLKL